MQIVDVKEKWTNRINTVTIGATRAEGGTRARTVTVGGETTLHPDYAVLLADACTTIIATVKALHFLKRFNCLGRLLRNAPETMVERFQTEMIGLVPCLAQVRLVH